VLFYRFYETKRRGKEGIVEYYFSRKWNLPFEEALIRIAGALKKVVSSL
jgi:hypothetical protein